eukprot:CAMPEP_0197006510 /NCGR_PEP_ID=MMETSP1380-20130617/35413_1 /TAXON_ID=5936 /ORGANISM="Euplotes crassus, Strain CT5" /LENGTH=322 /DNA_ID=CAMNT_0042426121 /DNA_START=98 /DNA_END=1064 /DNA_ORIENTATION=+
MFRKLYEADEMAKLKRVQAIMRSYLAAKRANAAKYGCYEFKEFHINESCSTSEYVDRVMAQYGGYKYDTSKSLNARYNDKQRVFKGKSVQENGAEYQGEHDKETGARHGMGTMVWADGARYDGWWRNDRANGPGRLIMASGDMYDGEWINDRANGHGHYIHYRGTEYEGQWHNDLQHGEGRETFPDGSTYTGQFRLGKKYGSGKFEWPDGSKYEGGFENNIMNGKGEYTWADGRGYNGDWVDGQMHGKEYSSGKTAEGTKENISAIRNMEKVPFTGRMEESMLDSGVMESSTVEVCIPQPVVSPEKASGKMVTDKAGLTNSW